MPKFRVYAKIHKNGKPRGAAYVLSEVNAPNEASARKRGTRITASWSKVPVNKREGVSAHVVKVVALTQRGTIKGKQRRRINPLDRLVKGLL